ncbi:MAG: hypothetical protein AB1430_12115 [Pseudomonadota bacterium]
MTVVSLHVPGVSPERLLRDWRPGAWIGAVRQAFDRTTELSSTPLGEVVEAHPPHWLVALWSPQRLQRPFLRRWPRWVSLVPGESESAAGLALLREVPQDAALWVLHEELEWALMAEIVLLSEPGLQAFQQQALQEFIVAERTATTARIRSAYAASHAGPAYGPLVRTDGTVRTPVR